MKRKTNEEALFDVAELFKIFADYTRVRILHCLLQEEKSVSSIASSLNMNQSAISHQLRILKNAKLIKSKRQGKTIIYSLADDHVHNIIAQGIDHINE